jgi:NADH-quinone oxidoreductase subunit L
VAVAALGIVGAVRLLKPKALVPARLAPPEHGWGRILWKKWYVDELYDTVIVRPLLWLSREGLWKVIDTRVIDGLLVNGSAAAARGLGWVGSQLQSGEVGLYVVLFVIGVLAVLGAALR